MNEKKTDCFSDPWICWWDLLSTTEFLFFKANFRWSLMPSNATVPWGFGHTKMFVFPKLGHALTYHSDHLKICWLKKCSHRIDFRCISLFEKWRYSSQLCYVSLPGGSLKKVVCFPGVGTNIRICWHVDIGAGGMPVSLSATIARGM